MLALAVPSIRAAATPYQLDSDSVPLDSPRAQGPLNAVCAGKLTHMAVGVVGEQEKRLTCTVCPPEVPNGTFWWPMSAIFGHFITPASDDVILSTYGCESHAGGLGGSFLLAHTGGIWKRVSYTPGLMTDPCKKVRRSDRRDSLLCEGLDGHLGEGHTSYEMVFERGGKLEHNSFFYFQDTTQVCRDFATSQTAVSTELRSTGRGYDLFIDVSSGRAELTDRQKRQCHQGKIPIVPTTKYRLLFRFDGVDFQPTPNTARAVKEIENLVDDSFF